MTAAPERDFGEQAAGVYPPSFCTWRLLLAVMVITQVAVILVGLGRGSFPDWPWLGLATVYAQWMALFCAAGICVMSGWTSRLSARGAWIGSWLIAGLLAWAFSAAAWLAAEVSLPGVIDDSLAAFSAKSVFAVGLVAVVFFRYLVIRTRWRAELIAQADARVQALQARIRPHFLFNSLNTIASLIPDDPDGAETATLDLADIFRGSMHRADQPIPLADELRLARQYLDMEKRRLGDRLAVNWQVEDLPTGAMVLPLMLQPLLENAVGHGIQARPEGGEITLYGRAESDRIVITIGNPLPPEGVNTAGHGMAIRNIRERLALAYGSRAGLITNQDKDRFFAVLSLPHVEGSDY